MTEFLDDAKEELKRVDHLIYVSLKYTRTVDVLKNIIERLINFFDFIIDGLLEQAKNKKKIKEIPISPKLKCEVLINLYKNDTFNSYIDFYLLLRRLSRAEYTRRNEYRRHVTMTAIFNSGEIMEINMDIINEYFEKAKIFVEYIEEKYVK
ncbi:hypothetical protein HQ529_02840 [Candidatus Woesearchaeota archaeon]|nr:hypothetical protein [Candidatus Woesearchaeota archaeon]